MLKQEEEVHGRPVLLHSLQGQEYAHRVTHKQQNNTQTADFSPVSTEQHVKLGNMTAGKEKEVPKADRAANGLHRKWAPEGRMGSICSL